MTIEKEAQILEINGENIIFRMSKITPKKIGQFVTIYKRPEKNNMPFESLDNIDYIIVH